MSSYEETLSLLERELDEKQRRQRASSSVTAGVPSPTVSPGPTSSSPVPIRTVGFAVGSGGSSSHPSGSSPKAVTSVVSSSPAVTRGFVVGSSSPASSSVVSSTGGISAPIASSPATASLLGGGGGHAASSANRITMSSSPSASSSLLGGSASSLASGAAAALGSSPSRRSSFATPNASSAPASAPSSSGSATGASTTAASAAAAAGGGAGAGAGGGTRGAPVPKQKKQSEMSKAERRAIQEAQRAAKSKAAAPAPKPEAKQPAGAKPHKQMDDRTQSRKSAKKSMLMLAPATKQVPLFSHLPQYERGTTLKLNINFGRGSIHPAIVSLGLRYADGSIVGSNARCLAMMAAFKRVIEDFQTPANKRLSYELEPALRPMIQFLVECRPMSVSMGNAINQLKRDIEARQLVYADESEAQCKEKLLDGIDAFCEQRIVLADRLIVTHGRQFISDGDVVLTHARSHCVEQLLKRCHDDKKRFTVYVVDSRPRHEGRELLRRLTAHGLTCHYILLSSIAYVLKGVTKVLVGAGSMLTNGALVSRVGTAAVAMMAHSANIPVLVCVETYKFCERVQLDSICFNELGNPDELVRDAARHRSMVGTTTSAPADSATLAASVASSSGGGASGGGGAAGGGAAGAGGASGGGGGAAPVVGGGGEVAAAAPLHDWKNVDLPLRLLNLVYDVTPVEFISAVVTELGVVPATSIPVVIREYRDK